MAHRRWRVYVEHGAGWGNSGDDALLHAALARLRRTLGPCTFVIPKHGAGVVRMPDGFDIEPAPSAWDILARWASVVEHRLRWRSRSASDTARRHRLVARVLLAATTPGRLRPGLVPGRHLRELIRVLDSCDALYVVGDNAVNDFYPEGAVTREWLVRAGRRLGKVVAVVQDFGPLASDWGRRSLASVAANADVIGLRDHNGSRRYLEALPTACEWRETGDETFALPPADPLVVEAVLDACGVSDSFVAVHFRPHDCIRDVSHYAARLAGLLDRIATELDTDLLFVPMTYDGHYGDDVAYAAQIWAAMAVPARLRVLTADMPPAVAKAIVGRASCAVGTSYHVGVFALCHNKPVVALFTGDYYRWKLGNLVRHYGPPSVALDLDSTGDDDILAAVGAAAAGSDVLAYAAINADVVDANDWVATSMAARLEGLRR